MLSDMCYTCLNNEKSNLIDLHKNDVDKTSYKQKLMTCLSKHCLEEYGEMKICRSCVKHLRVAYNFLQMVRDTQESIKNFSNLKFITETKLTSEDTYLKQNRFEDRNGEYCNGIKSEYADSEYEVKEELIVKHNDSLNDLLSNTLEKVKDDEIQKATKKVRNKSAGFIYRCPHCDLFYMNQLQLMKHMKKNHNKEKKFVCTYCNKGFNQAYHLQEHVTMHTGERNFSCPICDKTFLRASSQRRHVKAHDAAPGQKTKRTPFLCTICGKSFPFSNGVQRHMRTHLGIKRYECSVCKRKFMQSTHLSVHMRTHTGEKPYICDICGEAFSVNCSLQKHMNTHTSDKGKMTKSKLKKAGVM